MANMEYDENLDQLLDEANEKLEFIRQYTQTLEQTKAELESAQASEESPKQKGELELTPRYSRLLEETKEYFYALQTNIQLSGDDLKVIAVSSTRKNEGKTTTSVGLSVSLARTGYKVLLLDVDIRNSVLSGIFHSKDKMLGLTEHLSGKAEIAEIIRGTSVENLSVIESGQISPNPVALLRSPKFINLLKVLRNQFDYIIVDTPPIGQVIDAAIITQQCDASFLVTELEKISRTQLIHSRQQLEQTGVLFLGVVANKVAIEHDRYGYYGYGYYGQYGQSEETGKSKKKITNKKGIL